MIKKQKKRKKTPRVHSVGKNDFDTHFNILLEKGFIEQVGINELGEPEYRLSQKTIRLYTQQDASQATDGR